MTWSGIQSMSWLSSTMRSRNLVTATYQDGIALWISGVSVRQQCG